MKEKMKKRLVIVGLAVTAILLACGLTLILYTQKGKPETAVPLEKTKNSEEVVVPKITLPFEETLEETQEPEIVEKENMDIQEESAEGTGTTGSTTTSQKPSAGKPKTPEEVIIPEEPPELKDPEAEISLEETPEYVEPETEPIPQGGDQKDGMFYVPGFGWIEDSGKPNQSISTDNGLHNGNIVGDM